MVMIIDGSQVLYVYALTQSPLYTTDFIDVSVPFYTLRKIYSLIIQYQPSEVHIVFDIGRDLKKKRKYEKYKAFRNIKSTIKGRTLDSMVHERIQFARKLVYEILETTPIHSYLIPFIEGDTLIAFIAKQNSDKEKLIVSNDKDMFQLLDEKTRILSKSTVTKIEETITHKDIDRVWSAVVSKEIGLENIIKYTNNPPISYKCIPYYRAFLGDQSDGIPGIKGVGASTIGYIIQYQQYTGKTEFTSEQDFFNWLDSYTDDMYDKYDEITKIAYGKKQRKSSIKLSKLFKLIKDNDTRKLWSVFFELMDFDFAISELSSSVYSTLINEIRTNKKYDEEEFLELIRKYDLNSTPDYMKWHLINEILESGNWNLITEYRKSLDLESVFSRLYTKCVSREE